MEYRDRVSNPSAQLHFTEKVWKIHGGIPVRAADEAIFIPYKLFENVLTREF